LSQSGATNFGIVIAKLFIPITGLGRPLGPGRLRLPEFVDSRHMKEVKLFALHTGCLYLSGDIPVRG